MIGAKTWGKCQDLDRGDETKTLTATLIFATRSAREFPTAKMVKPMIASDSPKIKPNVYKKKSLGLWCCSMKAPQYLKDIYNFICDGHDPHDSDKESHRAAGHPRRRMVAFIRKDCDQNCHREPRHGSGNHEPQFMFCSA